MRKLALAVAAALSICGGAHAQSTTEELKSALDQAMRTIQDLQARRLLPRPPRHPPLLQCRSSHPAPTPKKA